MVEVFDLMEERQDDLVVGLYFVACLVGVRLEEVVSGRVDHRLLEDVLEVDLYFMGNLVEDRPILVGLLALVVLEVVVHAVLLVAHWLQLFSVLMLHL